jgi:hypothetical protein
MGAEIVRVAGTRPWWEGRKSDWLLEPFLVDPPVFRLVDSPLDLESNQRIRVGVDPEREFPEMLDQAVAVVARGRFRSP